MIPARLIAQKRDGEELGDDQITQLIDQYVAGQVPDYQMSAFAMAVYFQGMTTRETVALTRAMLASGEQLSWNGSTPNVDKHSTGGIGDKISLVLAPMMACCGLHIPMLSGRGLGITGGTLDKLESIKGFRTNLSIGELQDITRQVGCVITGTTPELAPADKKLYALRDVTGTVPSTPLIVASIMSKKLAENLNSLVLDVKSGRGAFMKSLEAAGSLGRLLVDVASEFGVRTTALVTDMNQPLGRSIGNAIEVREAINTLQGGGPPEVLELSIRLGSELLRGQGIVTTEKDAHLLQLQKIRDGSAFVKWEEMVVAQGGSLGPLALAKEQTITAANAGYIHSVDSASLGEFVIEHGGGRRVMHDRIDHGVGLEVLVRVGDTVEVGQPLVRAYVRAELDEARLRRAFVVGNSPVESLELIHDRIE